MFSRLKYKGEFGYFIYNKVYQIYRYLNNYRKSDIDYLSEKFLKTQGYKLDLKNPKTLNEKLQWLKLHNRCDFHTQLADKYEVRDFVKNKWGEEYLIPLFFSTTNYEELNVENMPNYPFIIKANHDSGNFVIVKDIKLVDWQKVRTDFRFALSNNYFWAEREYQYYHIKPRIVIEKLLISRDGKIPFDYKLNVINGKVEFIYVSVDREGENKRNIYDRNWKPLYFTWANKRKNIEKLRGNELEKPNTLDKMIEMAESIGNLFPYIRVDFYDVDGKIYFGEFTQHHGGGFDQIRPFEYDTYYGKLLKI